MPKLYDFELMLGSGRLAGYRFADAGMESGIVKALQGLADRRPSRPHGLPAGTPVLLYAMGDGNIPWPRPKPSGKKTKEAAADPRSVLASPLRYALVELVNLHDEALVFEAIHRIVFDIAPGGICWPKPASSSEGKPAGRRPAAPCHAGDRR